MTRCLVTGAAGFIGSHLVGELLAEGWSVRGLDDFSTGLRSRLAPYAAREDFSFREGDVSDADLVAEMVEGCEAVFHQGALPSVRRSWEEPLRVTRANCLGSAAILEAAVEAGVRTVVVASSSSVYGGRDRRSSHEGMCPDPRSPYALSKYWTEQLALQYGRHHELQVVALRYFNVFGPGQNPDGPYSAVIPKFIDRMSEGRPPVVHGDGAQTRDFTYVENAVRANLLAVEAGQTAVLNVGTGEASSVNDLVRGLNELLGTDLEPVHTDPRPGDVRHSLADITRVRELLGYRPTVGFEEGLRRTVAAHVSV